VFLPALKAMGAITMSKDGKIMASDQAIAEIDNLLPLPARVRRLSGTDPKYADRKFQSWMSFVGFAMRPNDSNAQLSELKGRRAAVQALVAKGQSLGYIPKK
jgi:hypothetical protein